jgi:acetylornithine aminotransferase
MPVNPAIARLQPYAFTQLRARQDALAGRRIIDLGVGDPQDETPAFIRRALIEAITPAGRYPTAAGLPELRQAIAGWLQRRFGVPVDPERHVLPANGSKEALYNLAPLLLDDPARRPIKELVGVPELAYQVYADSARLHHAEVLSLPLDRHWLVDLNAITPAVGERLKLLWLNYPNNPTGAVAPLDFYRDVLELAERYDFYVASDEAYSELWYDAPPPGLLQAAEATGFRRAIVINTLSKRSNMTAYRSGLIAGDPQVIAAMKNVRPRMGVATPEFIQRAAIAAWNDEAHVAQQRARYAERRQVLLAALQQRGAVIEGSRATFYLWVRVPDGVPERDSFAFAERLFERGLVVLPGGFMGPRGREYVRIAFVAPFDQCRQAAAILEQVY